MSRPSRRRMAAAAAIAVLPRPWKPWLYRRLLRYDVDRSARIGLSFIAVEKCKIGRNVTIGHGNLFIEVASVVLEDHVRVGHVNVLRGGAEIFIGRYAELLRRNELNSIPDADIVTAADPRLWIGPGAVITDGHRIDFTDRVEIGRRAIIGGRNSSLWTHNRQRTASVKVGEMAYVGSEIRMTPGAAIPARSVVGIGSVIVDDLSEAEWTLIAGVPARSLKPLTDAEAALVEWRTRADLPEDL